MGPVHHETAAESRDAVGHVRALIGIEHGLAVGSTAGVVVLHDHGRRTVHEIFQDIERIVQVREVRLARMLSRLEHLLLGDGAHQTVSRLDEFDPGESKVPAHQLVHGGLLVRVLAVAKSLLDHFSRVSQSFHDLFR